MNIVKNIIIYLLGFTILTSCGEQGPAEVENEQPATSTGSQFSISGKINNASGEIVYVEAMTERGPLEIAKTTIGNDGSFSIKSKIQGFGDYYLRLGSDTRATIPIVLSPGDNLTLNADKSSYRYGAKFSGPDWTNELNEFISLYAAFFDKMTALQGQQMNEYEQMKVFFEARADIDNFAFKAMDEKPGSPMNLLLFKQTYPAVGNLIGWNPENMKIYDKVSEAMSKQHPTSPIIATLKDQIVSLKGEQAIIGKQIAPDINLPDVNGNSKKLSDLRGNYVLIDFWASWCKPCRQENPNVVRLYNEFKNKKFTVFSVSLDDKKDKWKEAIQKDNLSWPNHVSDLKGWQSSVVSLYGFSGIPHTVLINPEGKIIGIGLRGGTLEWKLREALEN